MKKIPVLILIMMCANLAFGQTPVTLSIPKGLTGAAGSTLNVPITVTDVTGRGYNSFSLAISYDTTVLRATGYSLTGAIVPSSGWSIVQNFNRTDLVPGAINENIRWYYVNGATGGNDLTGAGTLITIQFTIRGAAGSRSPLQIYNNLPKATLNVYLQNDNPTVVSGSFGPPFPVSLASPEDGASLVPTPITVTWHPAIGAVTYRLQVSTSASFTSFVINDSTFTDTSKSLNSLAEGTLYFWRLNAKNPAGTCEYSDIHSFSTAVGIPAVPTLVSPADAGTNISAVPSLIWRRVIGATTYYLQVSADAGFTTTVFDDSTLTDTTQSISGLNRLTTYYWRLNAKGTGGTSEFSATRSFTTQPAGPLTPLPLVPVNNSVDVAVDPTVVAWAPSTGALTYRVQVSTSNTFTTNVFDQDTMTFSSVLVTGLAMNTTYYWHVSATNSDGTSPFSDPIMFTTIPLAPAAPTLSSPAEGATGIALNPTLSWTASAGAISYLLQVSKSNTFDEMLVNDSSITGTTRQLTGLENDTRYNWRVRAKNNGGISEFSEGRSFVTILGTPTLVAPANGATDQDTSLVLRWNRISGTDTYHVQLSKSSGFTTLAVNDSTVSDTSLALPDLDYSTTFYWHVSAKNLNSKSPFSAAAHFTVKAGVGIEQVDGATPATFGISQNFPNPFNPTTSIEVNIAKQSHVTLDVFDILGHRVCSLMNEEKGPGTYRVTVDGSSLASGTYFYTMKAGNFSASKKFTLMK